MTDTSDPPVSRHRLVDLVLDPQSIRRGTPEQEHERRVAMSDLVAENNFCLPGRDTGPYRLRLGLQDGKLLMRVGTEAGEPVVSHLLALKPLRSVLRDYFLICESYDAALRTSSPAQIEAIDMGRRGLHDEGAALLGERLTGKIDCDKPTLRRLFTLITALHWKG